MTLSRLTPKNEYKWIMRLMDMHTSITKLDVPDFRKF